MTLVLLLLICAGLVLCKLAPVHL